MNFQEIPQFTRSANYKVDVMWSTLKGWLAGLEEINLDPDFQRPHVWDEAKQIKYVEYVLRGGMSGKDIYFNHPGWRRGWEGSMDIVDGKQRLQAVIRFLDNEIPAFGRYLNEFEGMLPLQASFQVHVNDLQNRREVLQWYLDLNEGGVIHTEDELNKVRELLAQEEESPNA